MLHPNWHEVARFVLTSRALDHLEESELVPGGKVTYQFSARGHELAQVLLALALDQPHDAAAAYYRSRPFLLASGLTIEEALAGSMAKAGSLTGGRDIGVVHMLDRRGHALVLPAAGDVGSQYTPAVGWAQAIGYRQRVLMKMTVPDQSRRLDELSSLDGGARSLDRPANDYGEFAVAEFDNRAG